MKIFNCIFSAILLTSCAVYHSPDHATWSSYLRGASMTDMTPTACQAKQPVYIGAGGKTIDSAITKSGRAEYGDKVANDTNLSVMYMANLERELYDALLKPGMSVQRAGTDVVIILVRDAIMELDVADISQTGDDTLKTIEKILNKYNATFIEIAGYTDSMRDTNAAYNLSLDMAKRVGVHMAQHDILTQRLFIVGRGASRPIAAQDDVGRLTNRRVEIRISPAR